MSGDNIWTAVITAAVTTAGYWATQRTSRRANAVTARANDQDSDIRLSEEARKWVEAAQLDARQAKTEAAEARRESTAAHREAEQAHREAEQAARSLRDTSDTLASFLRWMDRVIRAATAIDLQNVSDPAVRTLVEVINGGPPDISTDRLRRDRA